MTDTDLKDRVTAAEHRIRELERLAYQDLADILNVRFSRVDRDLADSREQGAVAGQRLSKIEQVATLLQADVRDLRNGVTGQLRDLDQRAQSMDAKLDAILAKLGP